MQAPETLRERNRRASMHLIQSTAVGLFEADGFDQVSVEEIATSCGVSPMTIYRHFGNKESTVLWDEQDRQIDLELAQRLAVATPREAFLGAVVATLGARADQDLFLRRLKLIYATPAIWRRAAEQERQDRVELSAAFAAFGGRATPTIADDAEAAICLAALDVALDRWQQDNGKQNLSQLIEQALSVAGSSALTSGRWP